MHPCYSVCLLLMELNPKSYCQSPHQHGFILSILIPHNCSACILTLIVISVHATALSLRHTLLYSWFHTFDYTLPALWNAHSQRVMKLEIHFFLDANHSNPCCFPLVFFLFPRLIHFFKMGTVIPCVSWMMWILIVSVFSSALFISSHQSAFL